MLVVIEKEKEGFGTEVPLAINDKKRKKTWIKYKINKSRVRRLKVWLMFQKTHFNWVTWKKNQSYLWSISNNKSKNYQTQPRGLRTSKLRRRKLILAMKSGQKIPLESPCIRDKKRSRTNLGEISDLSSLLSRVHALAISLIYFSFCKCPKWTATICQTEATRDVFGIENASHVLNSHAQ